MKLLIISDTHGDYPLAVRTVESAGPVDLIVHLGDGLEDARIIDAIVDLPVLKVGDEVLNDNKRVMPEFARLTGQDLTYERLLAPTDGFTATVKAFRARGGRGLCS